MKSKDALPETIETKIFQIRGKKVMMDSDLAGLYGAETRILLQAGKRNLSRFPEDFMFRLTKAENLRSQIVTSSYGGRRHLPYAFTEQGVAMPSSVLNNEKVSLGTLFLVNRSLSPYSKWGQALSGTKKRPYGRG